jgi:hypothetical protein
VDALGDAGVPVAGMRRPASPTSPPAAGASDPAPWLNGAIAGAVLLGLAGAIIAVRRTRLAPG